MRCFHLNSPLSRWPSLGGQPSPPLPHPPSYLNTDRCPHIPPEKRVDEHDSTYVDPHTRVTLPFFFSLSSSPPLVFLSSTPNTVFHFFSSLHRNKRTKGLMSYTALSGDCPDMTMISSVSNVSGLSTCEKECTNHPKCTGFSHDPAKKTCAIRSGTVCPSPSPSSPPGILFYKRSSPPPPPSPKHDNTLLIVVVALVSILVLMNVGELLIPMLKRKNAS